MEQHTQPGSIPLMPGALAAVLFLGVVGSVATMTQAPYIMFPELAALSYGVFLRPTGEWARSPLLLAVTPIAAAVLGLFVTRTMPYGLLSVALVIACSMLIIHLLHSSVAPSISAGLLPLVLHIDSWWYPVSIAFGTIFLALLSIGYRRARPWLGESASAAPVETPTIQTAPSNFSWLPAFALFIAAAYVLGNLSANRLVLFPPLAVIAFQMFAHAKVCPWALRPAIMPIACTLTATIGAVFVHVLGVGGASVVLSALISIAVIRLLRLHMPPALAVALLPQVMHESSLDFVVGVAGGTLTLSLVFVVWKHWKLAFNHEI